VTNVTISTSDSTLTAIQDPDGNATNFRYNANKLLDKLINRHGDTTRYAYNANSWLVDSTLAPRVPIDAGGGSTTNQTPAGTAIPWQTIGVPTATTVTTAAMPALMSAIKATLRDPLNRATTYTVNADGRSLVTTTPLNQTTTVVRDPSWTEVPIRVTGADGGTDTLSYTADTPNLVRAVAAGDSAVNYHYGVAGQVDSVWTKGQLAERAFLNSTTTLTDSIRAGSSDSLTTHYTYDSYHRPVSGNRREWACGDLSLRCGLREPGQHHRAGGELRPQAV